MATSRNVRLDGSSRVFKINARTLSRQTALQHPVQVSDVQPN